MERAPSDEGSKDSPRRTPMAWRARLAHDGFVVSPSHRSSFEPGPVITLLLLLFGPEIRAWFGQAPLAKVFWVNGVATSAVLGVLFVLAALAGRRGLLQLLLLVLGAYSVWLLPSLWRCAGHAPAPWQQIVRLLTVAWAVNAALLGLFLEIWIISSGLGG